MAGAQSITPAKTQRLPLSILSSPLLLGAAMTWSFYQAIPLFGPYRDLAEQYFCSHPLSYATAFLFLTAVAILLVKAIALLPENGSLRRFQFDKERLTGASSDVTRAAQIVRQLDQENSSTRTSQLGRRVLDACEFVRGRQSARGLEEHLKYLAELAADRLHQSFAMVRTITWAIPILGFLGTVIGITIAIANVTPEQLDTSLGEVTGGLAVAFDTTALALALSIVLVFLAFIVERAEQRIEGEVEQFGIERLLHIFPIGEEATSHLQSAQESASERILAATDALIEKQVASWSDGLGELRSKWSEMLNQQTNSMASVLSEEVAETLQHHREQLEQIRSRFLEQLEDGIARILSSVEDTTQGQRTIQQELAVQMTDFWERIQSESESIQQANADQAQRVMLQLADVATNVKTQVESSQAQSLEHLQELRQQGDLLLKILEQEENLTRLQGQLASNLDSVRAAETFEATLHSLNAAVHLLTTRVQTKAA